MTPQQLRAARARLGLTQLGLAGELGVSWRTIARWEAGDAPVPNTAHLLIVRLMIDAGVNTNL